MRLNEMLAVKKGFGKEHGRQYIHIVQSFVPDERITHDQAHSIAVKLASRFGDYQALIATHRDRGHVHSHIVLNSVAYETGSKFQQSKNEMQAFKDYSDTLCRDAGLSIIEKHCNGMGIGMNELHAATKGDSWKFRLINAIDAAMQKCADRWCCQRQQTPIRYSLSIDSSALKLYSSISSSLSSSF